MPGLLEGANVSPLRIRVSFKTFTPTNTGMQSKNEFPELGSTFKAAFIKSACWWFAKTSVRIADAHPHDPRFIFISFCARLLKCNACVFCIESQKFVDVRVCLCRGGCVCVLACLRVCVCVSAL